MDVLERIKNGEVTLAFRRWKRALPTPGSRQRTAIGVLEIVRATAIDEAEITDADAKRSGARSRDEVVASLRDEGTLVRIELRYAGDDPRAERRETPLRSERDAAEIEARLASLDRREPWTTRVLELLDRDPEVAARELAPKVGMERMELKRRIRHLKELGLTESLEIGYRLSPRGRDLLALRRKKR
jgi:hypothetical protein